MGRNKEEIMANNQVKEKDGPFLDLSKNLNDEHISLMLPGEYKVLVENMLKRVDAYFKKTGLYNSADYKALFF